VDFDAQQSANFASSFEAIESNQVSTNTNKHHMSIEREKLSIPHSASVQA
jgi:hypothetical protein